MGEIPRFGDEIGKLATDEQTHAITKKNLAELVRRQEEGELEKDIVEFEFIRYYQGLGEALSRGDVGNRAVVLSQQELEDLGEFRWKLANGQTASINADFTGYGPEDRLVIFPEDLG